MTDDYNGPDRRDGEIRALEASMAKLGTDVEWIKLALQRVEAKVGCEDCAVSKDLSKAVDERKDAVKVISDRLDEHLKESTWSLDRILSLIGIGMVVLWEVLKAFATGKPVH